MTDLLQFQRNGQRGPTTDFLSGQQGEREVLVKQRTAQWKKSAEAVKSPGPAGYRVLTAFCGILDFIHQPSWQGASHAASAVFHVLLKEQGADSVLCRGMVESNGVLFDHWWVEIEGRVYDAAISNTGSRDLDSSPVFAGTDLTTKQESRLVYGVRSRREAGEIAVVAEDVGFNAYMDAFPLHKHGLWGVARDAGKRIGVRLNIAKLRAAYSDTVWVERAASECYSHEPVHPGDEMAAKADRTRRSG